MIKYIIFRLMFICITLLFILYINFLVFKNLAPEIKTSSLINQVNTNVSFEAVIQSEMDDYFMTNQSNLQRFKNLVWSYIRLDFGNSLLTEKKVSHLIVDSLPVTLSLGIFTSLFLYIIGIFLGFFKAKKNGSLSDTLSDFVLIILQSFPVFVIATSIVLLNVNFYSVFPVSGLVSDNFSELTLFKKVMDYLHHIFLPVLSNLLVSLFFITMFAKSLIINEFTSPYFLFMQSKGMKLHYIFRKYSLKNILWILFADMPAIIVGIIFGSSLFIEIIFSLQGVGSLLYNSFLDKDYPVIMSLVFLVSLLSLLMRMFTDLFYILKDKRIQIHKI